MYPQLLSSCRLLAFGLGAFAASAATAGADFPPQFALRIDPAGSNFSVRLTAQFDPETPFRVDPERVLVYVQRLAPALGPRRRLAATVRRALTSTAVAMTFDRLNQGTVDFGTFPYSPGTFSFKVDAGGAFRSPSGKLLPGPRFTSFLFVPRTSPAVSSAQVDAMKKAFQNKGAVTVAPFSMNCNGHAKHVPIGSKISVYLVSQNAEQQVGAGPDDVVETGAPTAAYWIGAVHFFFDPMTGCDQYFRTPADVGRFLTPARRS